MGAFVLVSALLYTTIGMSSFLMRGALQARKINSLRIPVRAGSTSVAEVEPKFILKFDPHDDPWFHESLRHPIPVGPRMIVIPDELKPLKQKEMGDWKDLTVDEQMDLYNMYFGMTIAELSQPRDQWKTSLGVALMYVSLAFLVNLFCRKVIMQYRDPYLRSEQYVIDNIVWQLKAHQNPITGYPSLWDYENNCWKK